MKMSDFYNSSDNKLSEEEQQRCVGLLTELLSLPNIRNLKDKIRIGLEKVERPNEMRGQTVYRGTLFLTSHGLLEIETLRSYNIGDSADKPSGLEINNNIVRENEFNSIARKYHMAPEFLSEIKSRYSAREY
jgi:hypothetical protein